jgi:hypothetical protein
VLVGAANSRRSPDTTITSLESQHAGPRRRQGAKRGTNSTRPQREGAAVDIRLSDNFDDLGLVARQGTPLVVWQRRHPQELEQWLDEMTTETLPDSRVLLPPADFQRAAYEIFDDTGVPATSHREYLIGDMNRLVHAYADICGLDTVDVRIDRISNDACWKFHRDSVDLRLLTTYRGPATEWVRREYAEAALREQRDYRGPLQQLSRGDVAIFRGLQVAGNDGIVHRSPPILASGTTRLLLCLNAPSEASPSPWTNGKGSQARPGWRRIRPV